MPWKSNKCNVSHEDTKARRTKIKRISTVLNSWRFVTFVDETASEIVPKAVCLAKGAKGAKDKAEGVFSLEAAMGPLWERWAEARRLERSHSLRQAGAWRSQGRTIAAFSRDPGSGHVT
jgi:hypothetical protein